MPYLVKADLQPVAPELKPEKLKSVRPHRKVDICVGGLIQDKAIRHIDEI
jgi:hypothetical protein